MGVILLNSTVQTKEATPEHGKNTFIVQPEPPGRTYIMQADSHDEMKIWIAAIQNTTFNDPLRVLLTVLEEPNEFDDRIFY